MNALFILSNSPGEVSGWMRPVTEALAKKNAGLNITGVTLPCQYASGMEAHSVRTLPGVTGVVPFREALFSTKLGRGLILQLGGDPVYGCALSLRMRTPWMIYSARPRWSWFVRHYFVPDDFSLQRFERARIAHERRTLVGNLILDSVPERDSCHVKEFRAHYGLASENIICFMPGSRPFEYELGFPFFCECARILRKRFPTWHAILPVAPTVDDRYLRAGLTRMGFSWRGGERVDEIIIDGSYRVPLVRSMQSDAIAASSLAVAFPGTNNLQIAALGVPLFMIAPLNQAENIPLDGVPGFVPTSRPPMRNIKKKVVFMYNAKEKYVSLPNRIVGREILPERRELMTPESTCAYISELIESPERLKKIKKEYAKMNLYRGAAEKIAQKVVEFFDKNR